MSYLKRTPILHSSRNHINGRFEEVEKQLNKVIQKGEYLKKNYSNFGMKKNSTFQIHQSR